MERISKAGKPGFLLLVTLVFYMPLQLAAQVPIDEYGQPLPALEPADVEPLDGDPSEALSDAELEELVGPVALYPDDLLAIVLPASTYPLEIVQAARFLDELAKDSSLEPDESWDESVIALLNYPEVVYLMDKEIDWTWRLGEAVITQQADVLAAVESFRDRAYAAGNLESDERQTVSNEDGVIEIEPVDDEIIYVPYYEPEEVIVYQPRRVYHYYPYAYPVYYYPYPAGYSFASGYFWGVTTAFTIGWHSRYLHVHHPSYWGHPYYGRRYYGHYYRRPSISVFNYWYVNSSYRTSPYRYRDGDYWRPRARHSGSRPVTQTVRNYHYSGRDQRTGRYDRRSDRRSDTRGDTRNRTGSQFVAENDSRSRQARNSSRSTNTRTAVDRAERTARTHQRQRESADVSSRRQRLVAQDARPTTQRNVRQSNSRQSASERTSRRTTSDRNSRRPANVRQSANRRDVARQATTQRTATRPATQRQQSRPSVRQQAPAQRPASRSSAQRASRNSGSSAAPSRQVQRAAAPSNRGSARGRKRNRK
ncbi:MAG: DUF3300 domain-containing protein [Woeseiaceae bacterium]|nr:DUF3300 domain-containing protein [Woeseiaceae bacterium]